MSALACSASCSRAAAIASASAAAAADNLAFVESSSCSAELRPSTSSAAWAEMSALRSSAVAPCSDSTFDTSSSTAAFCFSASASIWASTAAETAWSAAACVDTALPAESLRARASGLESPASSPASSSCAASSSASNVPRTAMEAVKGSTGTPPFSLTRAPRRDMSALTSEALMLAPEALLSRSSSTRSFTVSRYCATSLYTASRAALKPTRCSSAEAFKFGTWL